LFFFSPNADVLYHPSATANAQVLEGIPILIPRQKIDLQKNIPSIKLPLYLDSLRFHPPKHQSTHEKRRRLVPAGGMKGRYQSLRFYHP